MNSTNAMNEYKAISIKSGIESATAHGLIEMLFSGALKNIAAARLAMSNGKISEKCESVGKALAIVEYLRVSLDPGIEPSFSERLSELYHYMEAQLYTANKENDDGCLLTVQSLLQELSEGWSGIPKEYRS
jgi:flagellar protein FliS